MKARVINPTKKKKKKAVKKRTIKKSSKKILRKKRSVPIMKTKKRRKKRTVAKKATTKKRRRVLKTRKNPTKRYYVKAHKSRRRKRRKNPTINFLGLIQTSVLAGMGGIMALAGTTAIARIAKVEKSNQKNLISLAIALMASFMLPKTSVKSDQANALLGGLWAIVWIKFLKQVMPAQAQDFLTLEGNSPANVDRIVNQMLGLDYTSDPELELLGEAENTANFFGEAENDFAGYTHDPYDVQIF